MAAGLAAATALASASAFGVTAAAADTQLPSAEAETAAHGHGLWLEGLGLEVAGGASVSSEFPDSQGPSAQDLDLALLERTIQIGGGVNLPLLDDGTNEGLLALGGLGALSSYSASPSATSSVASSGIISEDGSIDLGPVNDPSSFDPAELDVTALLGQVLTPEVSAALLDEASLSIGALASRVEAEDGVASPEYSLSGLDLTISSPAVEALTGDLETTVGGVLGPGETLLGEDGTVGTIVGGLVTTLDAIPGVDATLNSLGLNTGSLQDDIVSQPIENAEGSVSIDLGDGTISVDLDELAVNGAPGENLSGLAPNTSVLSGDTVNAILAGVSDALLGDGPNSLVANVTEAIYGIGLTADIQVTVLGVAPLPPLADAPVYIDGELGGILGVADYDPLAIDVSGLTALGIPLGGVLAPITNALTGTLTTITGALVEPLTSAIAGLPDALLEVTGPLVTTLLDDALEPVLSELLAVTINEQPDESDLGPEGFTVRALSVTLLPLLETGAVTLQLGSSSVFPAALPAASLAATPNPVEQGGTVTLTGGGFTSGEDVTVTFPGGTTETVVADEDGSISVTWEVPEDFAPGTVTFSAAGGTSGLTATATTEVIAEAVATLSATPNPVEQGGTVTLSGGGFTGGEDVTVVFPDGSEETVTADEDGTISTDWEVPADFEPGEATFTATGVTSGLVATATTVVEAAADADVNANASASASASADAAADGDASASAQAAAQAAANDDNTSDASAAADVSADAAAEVAATADASSEASAESNAAASAAATASADSTADSASNADASAAASAAADADASAASDAASEAAAEATSSADASSAASADATADADADVNANASASASASADAAADDDASASAQAAAQAAANDDNTSDASAAADVSADAAAEVAATADASSEASAESNAAASAAATASADSTADSASNADASAAASAAADADASAASDAASEAAAEATSSADASSAASADATGDADGGELVVSDPADVTVTEGEDAVFTVEVVSGSPTSIMWEEYTPVAPSDSAAEGLQPMAEGAWSATDEVVSEDGTALTVEAAEVAENGTLFRAVATDGTTTVETASAELTVLPVEAADADSSSGGAAEAGGAADAGGTSTAGGSSSASASGSGDASGGYLSNTGGESQFGLGIAGLLLVLAGAGIAVTVRRRNLAQRT